MEVRKKVLVVDDEIKIVEIVKAYLEKNEYNVITAFNGKDAINFFEREKPALVILDLMLPDLSGEDVCRQIRKISSVPIIMLTAKVSEKDVINGLNIGADGYILKPFSPNELVARVSAILRRAKDTIDPLANIFNFNDNDLVIDILKHEVKKTGNVVNLTPTEYKILIALIKYSTKLFTREELISIVFDDCYDSFDRTIDTHIKNLRQKIETNSKNPQYILTVHGVGYKFGGDSL
ncbi:MAG: response regulator transcription factor [Clostridia bacterium]|jgi:DNA-binding response OmpR family regulator|nr:response regulator transcription factor [Clostridia bacterium]